VQVALRSDPDAFTFQNDGDEMVSASAAAHLKVSTLYICWALYWGRLKMEASLGAGLMLCVASGSERGVGVPSCWSL
jgi:hypothetical protein